MKKVKSKDLKPESDNLRPNNAEIEFLDLAYTKFYEIFDEALQEGYWTKDPTYRFRKIQNAFAIYSEVLNYEPINWAIKEIKDKRPPMEAEIGSEFFKFIRHIFVHFPFFDTWDQVWINKPLVNWYKKGQKIDSFLSNYSGRKPLKYRIWDHKTKKMTYFSICFPSMYDEEKIFLNDIMTERAVLSKII